MTAAKPKTPMGAGAPRLYGEVMNPRTVRLTEAQAEKLRKLGGGAWVRGQIDKAKI